MDRGRRPFDYYKDANGVHPMFNPDWDSTFNYIIGDVVFYSGKVYKCIQAGKDQQPDTETSYWTVIESSVSELATSIDWTATHAYSTNDIVNYGGLLYQALQASTNKNPSSETTYWALHTGRHFYSTSAPTTEGQNGDVWFMYLA